MTDHYVPVDTQDRCTAVVLVVEAIEIFILDTALLHRHEKSFTDLQYNVTGKAIANDNINRVSQKISSFYISDEVEILGIFHEIMRRLAYQVTFLGLFSDIK